MMIKKLILGLILLFAIAGTVAYGFNLFPAKAGPSPGASAISQELPEANVVPQSNLRKFNR